MKLLLGAIFLIALATTACQVTYMPDGGGGGSARTGLDVYCPTAELCEQSAEYALTGFEQSESNVIFEYWMGQVPCDQAGTDFPCPAGGNTALVPTMAIAQGVAEWDDVAGIEVTFSTLASPPDGSACGGTFSGLDTLKRSTDGRNTIMFAPLNGAGIGLACWWFGTNECDIILDNTWPGMSAAEAARTVVLHEAGHCFGLAHSDVSAAAMYSTYIGPKNLHADDIAGLRAIYGETSATPTIIVPTSTPTPIPPSPTPLPVPTLKCGERVWTSPEVYCSHIPGVAADR